MAGLGKGSNPCNILNSYQQGSRYDLVSESGPPHNKEFTFSVNVHGVDYLGTGRSKKLAKQAAAAAALRSAYNINTTLSVPAEPATPPSGKILAWAKYSNWL